MELRVTMDRKDGIAYSCVVDRDPDFFFQSMVLISSLVDVAGVDPAHIFVHHIGEPDAAVAATYAATGVTVVPCAAYDGGNRYLNKLVQFDTAALAGFNKVALCDCDLAFLAPLPQRTGPLFANPVDHPNPPLGMLRRVLGASGLAVKPEERRCIVAGRTLAGNCNGGLYLIDAAVWRDLGASWRKWAAWLGENRALLPGFEKHSDQIAFALATWDLGLPVEPLGAEWNVPLHLDPARTVAHDADPAMLHFHREFGPDGEIRHTGNPSLDLAIDTVNAAHRLFWHGLGYAGDAAQIALMLQRRARWLNWRNDVSQRPLPLPNHLEVEKPIIAIETQGQCQYRCNYCPVSVSPLRKGRLDETTFRAIIDDLAPYDGQFQLRFHFYNEPLLDKRLAGLAAYAREVLPNTFKRLVSNGDLLDRATAERMFAAGVDHIAISCHKEEVFTRLSALLAEAPELDIELRRAYANDTWSNRLNTVTLEGYNRQIPAGVKPWGCNFLTIQIDYEGRAHMCCEDFRGELVMGNVKRASVIDILRRAQPSLKRTYCGFYDGICSSCAGLSEPLPNAAAQT